MLCITFASDREITKSFLKMENFQNFLVPFQLVERDLRRLRDPLRLRLPASASSLLKRGKGGEGGILASQININNLKSLLKDKLG